MRSPTGPTARLRVVLDPEDLADTSRSFQELHSLEAGRVVCHPRPGIRSTVLLAEDLLFALGKTRQACESLAMSDRWSAAEAWLVGEGIRHLVVLRSDRLPLNLWRAMARLRRSCHITVWMVVHRPRIPHHPSRRAIGLRRYCVADALDAIRRDPEPEVVPDAWPTRLEPAMSAKIRRLASPREAAALAVLLATDLSPRDLLLLRCSSLTDDGRLRDVQTPWTIPQHARGLIRSHAEHAVRHGGSPTAYMFLRMGRGLTTGYSLWLMLRRAERLAGLRGVAVAPVFGGEGGGAELTQDALAATPSPSHH